MLQPFLEMFPLQDGSRMLQLAVDLQTCRATWNVSRLYSQSACMNSELDRRDLPLAEVQENGRLPATISRITFTQVTQKAVLQALEQRRAVDQHLVNSYHARFTLDYLHGMKASQLLRQQLPDVGAKSAGMRV